MKEFAPVLLLIAFIIGGLGLFISFNSSSGEPETNQQSQSPTAERSILEQPKRLLIGDSGARATLVEYFDYKCPACNQFHRGVGDEIKKEYLDTGLANLEIKITPVIGPDSANAARGAYCALEQNLFGEYHETVINYMYDNYYASGNFAAEFDNILTTSELANITEPLGIDRESFVDCVDSDTYNEYLNDNLLAAAEDGIRGTPGFAVGEQSFVGGQPFTVFKTLLDIQLR